MSVNAGFYKAKPSSTIYYGFDTTVAMLVSPERTLCRFS